MTRQKSNREACDRIQVSLNQLVSLSHRSDAASLKNLKIRAILSGNYLSRVKGRGMEFDEVRLYTPGDDMRSLDWKVTARTGRPHTKLYREERERPIFLSVDYRSPMFFATRGSFKSVVAAKLASIVAWSGHRHSDRVGGQIFTDGEFMDFKPRRGKQAILHLLKNLADLSAQLRHGQASLSGTRHLEGTPVESASMMPALQRLQRHARPGSVIFLVSDFRGMDDNAELMLIRLARHCDLVLLMVFDEFERELPGVGRYRISDGDRRVTLNASDDVCVARYKALFRDRRERVSTLALKYGMRFLDFSTTQPPEQILPRLADQPTRRSG